MIVPRCPGKTLSQVVQTADAGPLTKRVLGRTREWWLRNTMAAALVAVQAADVVTTIVNLKHGIGEENPFEHFVIAQTGSAGLIATKAAFAAGGAMVLRRAHLASAVLVGAVGIGWGLYPVIHNILHIGP